MNGKERGCVTLTRKCRLLQGCLSKDISSWFWPRPWQLHTAVLKYVMFYFCLSSASWPWSNSPQIGSQHTFEPSSDRTRLPAPAEQLLVHRRLCHAAGRIDEGQKATNLRYRGHARSLAFLWAQCFAVLISLVLKILREWGSVSLF